MKMFLILCIGLIGAAAQAGVDVTCYENDCLQFGWEIYNENTGQFGTVECLDQSCENSGFVERDHFGRVLYQAECLPEGCFKTGWIGYLPNGARILEQRCHSAGRNSAPDCLQAGWEITDYHFINNAYCVHNDCRKYGWNLYTSRGMLHIQCKPQGCFVSGWRHL